MVKVNYHIHSTGSDGEHSPKQVAEKAIKAKISHICFTDHYPLPKKLIQFDIIGGVDKKEEYKKISKTKEEFKDKLDISFGMEFDYLDGFLDYTKEAISKGNYDFVIGSAHLVFKDGEFFDIPWTSDKWADFVKVFGTPEEAIKNYYGQVLKIIRSGLFDCVGHFDLIKICYNHDWKKIEKQEGYRKIVLNLLDEIKKSKMCIEINTSGWNRPVKEQYPSKWILSEAMKRDIPITIGTDFHGKIDELRLSLEEIDMHLERAIRLAKEVGYKKILIFHNRKPMEIEI